jgi:hypothetical protein
VLKNSTNSKNALCFLLSALFSYQCGIAFAKIYSGDFVMNEGQKAKS